MKIAVYLPASPWGEIDENAPARGLGGRETALVRLCQQWAELGVEVYAFVPRKTVRQVDVPYRGALWNVGNFFSEPWGSGGFIRWIPAEQVVMVTPHLGVDLFISWENAEVITALRDAGYDGRAVIEMQVAHLFCDTDDLDVVDEICVLSEWAKRIFLRQHPIEPDKITVLPNGISGSLHSHPEDYLYEFDTPLNFIYSSSPDRGLHHLLAMWPEIQELCRAEYDMTTTLHVCYGIEGFVGASRWSHRADAERALQIERLIDQPGVHYHGRIGQDQLAAMQSNASAMLYPCDTLQATETGCISLIEALALRLPVVSTDCDCLGEEFGAYTYQASLPLDYGEYIDLIPEALASDEAWRNRGQLFAQERSWHVIARQWLEHFALTEVAA